MKTTASVNILNLICLNEEKQDDITKKKTHETIEMLKQTDTTSVLAPKIEAESDGHTLKIKNL